MKDDLLHTIDEEMEALLYSVEILIEPLESGSTNHFEDDELYIAIRDVNPEEQTKDVSDSSDNIT